EVVAAEAQQAGAALVLSAVPVARGVQPLKAVACGAQGQPCRPLRVVAPPRRFVSKFEDARRWVVDARLDESGPVPAGGGGIRAGDGESVAGGRCGPEGEDSPG